MHGKNLSAVIVEDNPQILDYLRDQLERMDNIKTIGCAMTVAEGRILLKPDIDLLLVDLDLPDGRGNELIQRAKAMGQTKVIVVTIFGDEKNVIESIEAGADGYLLKDADQQTMAIALQNALDGIAPISPAIAGHLLQRIRKHSPPQPVAKPVQDADISLTNREVEILETLAKGFSYKEIAKIQNVSFHTVNEHLKAVYRKMAVHSRGEAVYEAVKTGLIDP